MSEPPHPETRRVGRLMRGWRELVPPAFVTSTVLGLLFGVQALLVQRPPAAFEPITSVLAGQLVPLWAWGAMAVVLLPVMHELQLYRLPPLRLVLSHLALAAAAGLVHVLLMTLGEITLGLYGFEGTVWSVFTRSATYRFVSNFVFYAPIAAVYHAAAYIEDLKRARDEIRRSERRRLLSLRQLAGGLSHELSNALTAAVNTAELALENLDEHPAAEDVRDSLEACRRLLPVTRELQALGGELRVHPEPVEAAEVVTTLGDVVAADGLGVHLRRSGGRGEERVIVDLAWLREVLHLITERTRSQALPREGWWITDAGMVDVPDSAGFVLETSHRALRRFSVETRTEGSVDTGRLFEASFVHGDDRIKAHFSLATAQAVMAQMDGHIDASWDEGRLVFAFYLSPAKDDREAGAA